MPSVAWGIDLGYGSVKAVRLERAGRMAEILDFDTVELAHTDDDSLRPAMLHTALAELVGRKPEIIGEPVVLSIPGNQTFFRPLTLPGTDESRMQEMIRHEARQQIPFPLEDVLWDYVRLASKGKGGEAQFALVAIKRDIIEQLVFLAESLHLQVAGVQPGPLALYNFVLHELQPDKPLLVLDGGLKVTDFLIVDGDNFWFRPLAQSGSSLTKALADKFSIELGEAEEMKLKLESGKQADQIFKMLTPALQSLSGNVRRTLGYYKSLHKKSSVESILALGGTFKPAKVRKFVADSLDMKVRLLDELKNMRASPTVDVNWLAEELPGMCAALGLGIQGLGLARIEMKLLPERIVKEHVAKKKRPLVATGAVLVLLAVLVAWIGATQRLGVLTGTLDETKAALQKISDFRDKVEKEQQVVPVEEFRLLRWSRIGRDRGVYANVLDRVTRLADEGGKSLFGPEAKTWITHLYISRTPPTEGMRKRPKRTQNNITGVYREERTPGPRRRRTTKATTKRKLPSRREAVAKKASDEVVELPPDVPINVILEGEIAGWKRVPDDEAYQIGLQPAFDIETALKEFDDFRDVRLDPDYKKVYFVEEWPEGGTMEEGTGEELLGVPPAPGSPPKAGVKTRPYILFEISWWIHHDDDIREKSEGGNR